MQNALDILKDLIAIPSVNPMGRQGTDDAATYGEGRLAEYLESFFCDLGVECERQYVFPGRYNVIARFEGRKRDEKIVIESHMDTVPVDNMEIDPFSPEVREGKIFGRGSCDTKGTMACVLSALQRIVKSDLKLGKNVVFVGIVDEEHLYSGIKHLIADCVAGEISFAIVTEPTDLDVVIAHKGLLQWQIATTGIAAHGSTPKNGKNAIYAMAPLLKALEKYCGVLESGMTDPLLGAPTLNVGCISGGSSINTVPDKCIIDIEYRLVPKETSERALQEIEDFLQAEGLGGTYEFYPPFLVDPPMDVPASDRNVQRFLTHVKSVNPHCEIKGVSFGTDASKMSSLHIPCVVFGAGSIEQAHTKNEWVPLVEVQKAEEILFSYLLDD